MLTTLSASFSASGQSCLKRYSILAGQKSFHGYGGPGFDQSIAGGQTEARSARDRSEERCRVERFRDLPVRYRSLKIEAPVTCKLESIKSSGLPGNWSEKTDLTRAIGDTWFARGSTALLSAPWAIAPETFNVLLTPAQQDANRIVIAQDLAGQMFDFNSVKPQATR
jgi:hypothetical protein